MPSYFFVVVGLLSFAGMGILHKVGDRLQGEPLPIAFYALMSAGFFSAARALRGHGVAAVFPPTRVILLSLPFGCAAGLALWCLQRALRDGSIAATWLIINLSAALPTVLSVLFYHEVIGWKKSCALGLVTISMFLLWWDRRDPKKPATPAIVTTEAI